MKNLLKSISHFLFLPELRLFKYFKIAPQGYAFADKSVKFYFDEQPKLRESDESPRIYLKTYKNDYVYLCDGVIVKSHYYRTLARRTKITFATPLISSMIKQRGLGEAVYHSIAYSRLNNKEPLRIPRILSIQSFKKLGLVYKHQLEIEYIPDATNFADYLTSDLLDKNATSELLMQLKRCFLLMAEQGILHLDLRPENIFLGSDNQLYLIDWEYACLSKGICPMTYSNFSFASLLYMLERVQNPAPHILSGLIDIIKTVLGSEFRPDIFYPQYKSGLGKKRAHDFLINTVNSIG